MCEWLGGRPFSAMRRLRREEGASAKKVGRFVRKVVPFCREVLLFCAKVRFDFRPLLFPAVDAVHRVACRGFTSRAARPGDCFSDCRVVSKRRLFAALNFVCKKV